MLAKKVHKKGAIIQSDYCQPFASLFNKVPTCSNCAISLVSSIEIAGLVHSLDPILQCDQEKCNSTVYCSEQCKTAHYKQHNLLCRKDKHTNQFYKYATKCNNERMIHALHLINLLILKLGEKKFTDDREYLLCFEDLLSSFLHEYAISSSNSSDTTMHQDEVEESYLYLKSLLLYDTKSLTAIKLLPTVLTLDKYNNILAIAHQYMIPVVTNTPALDAARNIIKIKAINERISLFTSLMSACNNDLKKKIGYDSSKEYSPLEYDRLITQFVNLISTISSSVPAPSLFQGLFYILIPPSQLFTHSCAYNAVIELVPTSPQAMVQCIALYDINEGEAMYISNKPPGDSCTCSWCWYNKLGFAQFTSKENQLKHNYKCDNAVLMTIAHTCMQQGREASGVQLYQHLLSLQDTQQTNLERAVLYYTLGVALLNMPSNTQQQLLCGSRVTRWMEAYDYFIAGVAVDAANKELSEINEKLLLLPVRAYDSHEIHEYTSKSSNEYTVIVENQICILKEASAASEGECSDVIKEAEAYAGEHGWTTTRHPFVPTTDLPVYKIPRILSWFNTFMDKKVIPLLIKQYIPASSLSCRIGIHDAFVVKYEASNQRSLPIHTDQSTHSLIIALNDHTEYTGGGTYFKRLDTSYRLNKGEVLSFPGGSMEHAGDPLLHGTRYIIAVFLFLDFTENNKRKFNEIAQAGKIEIDGEITHFQFNFDET